MSFRETSDFDKLKKGDKKMDFEKVYAIVAGIVNKGRKEFYIEVWNRDDWGKKE